MNELKYLKLCGFRKENGGVDVSLKKPISAFYPKVSCVLDSETGGYSFILHYSPDEGYARHEVHFTLEEAEELREKLKDSLFKFFSIPDSFLIKVRKSRAGGRKAWKIRHFPIPAKKAKVYEVFGLEVPKKVKGVDEVLVEDGSVSSVLGEARLVAKRNMEVIVQKAAKSYSLQAFGLYYEAYKEYYGKEGGGKSKAWNLFLKQIKEIQ